MPLAKFVQEPNEQKRYVLDYSDWLDTGETISSVAFSISPAGMTVPSSTIGTPANTVSFFITGGTSGTKYTVEAQITTSAGQVKEDQLVFIVREY